MFKEWWGLGSCFCVRRQIDFEQNNPPGTRNKITSERIKEQVSGGTHFELNGVHLLFMIKTNKLKYNTILIRKERNMMLAKMSGYDVRKERNVRSCFVHIPTSYPDIFTNTFHFNTSY